MKTAVVYRCACGALVVALVAGCASHRVRPQAAAINTEITAFQADLAGFQTDLARSQKFEQTRVVGSDARRDSAASATKQLETEWALAASKTNGEMLSVLRTQGLEELARLNAPASATLPGTSKMPVEKLGDVAATLDQLAQGPSRKADLEFLLGYTKQVNKELQSIEQKAQANAKAATADAAAAAPK